MSTDIVNHPAHYESQSILLEPIDFCEKLPFCEGNALKYCFRAGHKEGASELEDLKKAQWYLLRAKNRDRLLMTETQKNNFAHVIQFLKRCGSPIIINSANHAEIHFEHCFYFFEHLLEKINIRILELEKQND